MTITDLKKNEMLRCQKVKIKKERKKEKKEKNVYSVHWPERTGPLA